MPGDDDLEDDWDYEDNDDDPTDPNHPDHDLSTTAAYDFDDYATPYRGPWFTRRWILLLVAIVVILGLLIPLAAII